MPEGFSKLLRTCPAKRRLSQLYLALESGVSQRHLSFLESGRAHPGRIVILHLSETLEVPLCKRNLVRLFSYPRGIKPLVVHWPAVAPLF